MSYGGWEIGRVCAERDDGNKRVKFGSDEFGQAIAKIAVAQICESEGYLGFQQSALEAFSNVALSYIENMGKSAIFHANLAGRTGCNIFDIVQGLEDFGAVQGFPGASDINRCPLSSGVIMELSKYVSESEEIPFLCKVPQFPVIKDRKLAPSFLQVDEESPSCHIPSWLPAFPESLTYISSPKKEGNGDNLDQKNILSRPRKHNKVRPILSLHFHMSRNGLERLSSDTLVSSMVASAAEINPFLASPLKQGEVQVSPVVFPGKLVHYSPLEKITMEDHVQEDNHFLESENSAPLANQFENHIHVCGDKNVTTRANKSVAIKFSIRVSRKYKYIDVTSKDGCDEEKCVGDN